MKLEDFEVELHGHLWRFKFVPHHQMPPRVMGFTAPSQNLVVVDRDLPPTQILATLVHELCHVVLLPWIATGETMIPDELVCDLWGNLWGTLIAQRHKFPSWVFEGIKTNARPNRPKNKKLVKKPHRRRD